MTFDLQPTLAGPRLTLTPLRAEDREALWKAASDPLIWEQHPDKTRSTPEGFAKMFTGAIASGGCLVARDAKTGEVIGWSRYHDYDQAESVVEIGFTFLVRKCWGGTWNHEMKRVMLEHAFRFVHRVHFKVAPINIRSQKAVEKIGGVRIGMGIDGLGRESIVFELTRPAFLRGPLATASGA